MARVIFFAILSKGHVFFFLLNRKIEAPLPQKRVKKGANLFRANIMNRICLRSTFSFRQLFGGIFVPPLRRVFLTPRKRAHNSPNPFATALKTSRAAAKIDQLAAFHGGKAAAEQKKKKEGKKWEMKRRAKMELQETPTLFEWKIYVYM